MNIKQLFRPGKGITFDDFIILPDYIDFDTSYISLRTKITDRLCLNTPIISSPMDTVTGQDMAIAMALQGGLGIIHYNNSIDEQVKQVAAVKRYSNAFIWDPVTVKPTDTVESVKALASQKGFSCFPVVPDDDNDNNSCILGIVGSRDLEPVKNDSIMVQEIMQKTIVTGPAGISLSHAFDIIKQEKVNRLPILDATNNNLIALVCRKDMKLYDNYPLASRDSNGRLLVGAAVSTHPRDRERIDHLVKADVDIIIIDSSQGHSKYQIDTIRYIKEKYNNSIDVIAGNVVTAKQAIALVNAGADGLRCGMGSGSCCITQDVCGVGRAQASAVWEVSNAVGVPVISDGGIKNTGHMLKALACGASAFMLGSMLAATEESPSITRQSADGVPVKTYRGMGSLEAMEIRSTERYLTDKKKPKVAQGISGFVKLKGSVHKCVPEWVHAIKQGMQDMGLSGLYEPTVPILVEKRSFGARRESIAEFS